MIDSADPRLTDLPQGPGCYVFKDAAGVEIYVGKAVDLRRRVRSYFQGRRGHPARTLRLVQEVCDLHLVPTRSEVEALLLENRLIKELQPRYNVRLKDDKTYPSLAITREEFPRVFITRERNDPAIDYFGPFSSMSALRRAYQALMRIFQFRICTLDLREDDPGRRRFRPCLNYHIKRCSAPCTTRIDAAAYGRDIAALRTFLEGGASEAVVGDIEAAMRNAAAGQRYEDAARYRDQLSALGRLAERNRSFDPGPAVAPTIDHQVACAALAAALELTRPPRVIEGFDIAHLQGTEVVASCVQFVDGLPHRDGYRHFRIRGGVDGPGNDDVTNIAEVVGRRLRRLQDQGLPAPDLMLIDGGDAQLQAALAVAREVGHLPECMVGLAKKEETVVRSDGSSLRLGRRHAGLRLLMYVRDEAHRFCRRYHHLLRGKAQTPRRRRRH